MTRRRILLAAGLVAMSVVGGEARAAGWADRLFVEHSHDFGAVPRGAIVRHPFVLTNTLNEPVTIQNVRASCGCTTGWANRAVVPPGEQAVVEAQMDTRNFVGLKATVLFVDVATASGYVAEVRLPVQSNILSDIVLNPGALHFGTVVRGQSPKLNLTIDRVGAPGWRAERMVSSGRALEANLYETARANGQVSYRLEAAVKADAPTGLLRDEIRILTNDPSSPAIPVTVTAQVVGNLNASPASLAMGQLTSTQPKQGRILLRGTKPFTVTGVEGADQGLEVKSESLTARPLQVLAVAFDPEKVKLRGAKRWVLKVSTDLPGEPPLEIPVTAELMP